ncbi:two-component system, OmpR family, sensor kinase [Rhizobiales bacterium GAS191]|jgi:two-component system OmpR family sensor kinase|nr:two-component system, OmpR family, sensor kinase [Rhizobiales bacterium GAS191]SEC72351.1 two-component system, OmpR family, sensor kinase [Rhizobiales bacterium GAS188]
MTSLRRTALIWMTALLMVVGVLAFFLSYELARREAAEFLDGQLRQVALNAGQGFAFCPKGQRDPEDEFATAIWNAAGEPLRNSPKSVALPRQTNTGYATIEVGGEYWRVYLASDARHSVQVAQRLRVREQMAEAAALRTGVPILLVIPLSWVVVGWAQGRVLGRFTDLAGEIAERGVDSRKQIPVTGIPAEIRPLAEAINVMANRLQRALEQQKRFVSDAAHELRTPLAALHIQIDNLRASGGDGQSSPISELRSGVSRATALIEQMLRLARSDETIGRTPHETVNLSDLVTQCVADFIPIAAAKGVDLGIVTRDAVLLCGWAADLKMLVDNLVDNAIRYTPAGGSIDVSVRQNSDSIAVEVLDTGCGVADADIPRLFDRFFRATPINVEGSGLGLSIAAAVAERHGFAIQIENRTDCRGLRVSVSRQIAHSPVTGRADGCRFS